MSVFKCSMSQWYHWWSLQNKSFPKSTLRLQWPLKNFLRAFRISYECLEACKWSYLFAKANGVTIWGVEKKFYGRKRELLMIFENWYQLTQCSRQGDFKKVVFYQADRTISVASKIFSTASRDMIWVFEGLQMIISIFWNKQGGHSMLRTDSTDANVRP